MSLGSHAGEVAVPGAALETGMISLALGSRPGSSGTGSPASASGCPVAGPGV